MLEKILELKNAKALDKMQQKQVKGGIIPFPTEICYCITRDRSGFLVISEEVSCDSTCEDGSSPTQS
ncbi:hypothetical protein [Aquimarina sp. 2201CG14-23]|uniref:hypothetical protein n=1 Tax=Aquimarina mycalae TaxID=3040073 RepID=UPI0024780B8E|nr:hypothetical protein [Aquimarina sp. 2201CG14-23]MDH7446500.1 hypothetical protein [Aquimarina sp. 2201CG14-23]